MTKIYHYTSVNTLALILRHKTIRFSRLDKVDDVEESCYTSGLTKTNFGQYVFVSCWTKEPKEILPMWKMYTDYKGVRIGMDEDLFVMKDSVLGVERNFFVLPDSVRDCEPVLLQNETKLHEVCYVEDIEERISKLIEINNENKLLMFCQKAGLYKRNDWDFQKESRFKIVVSPLKNKKIKIPLDGNPMQDLITSMIDSQKEGIVNMLKNTPIKEIYIDIPFNPDRLNNMEITLGPQTSEGEKGVVRQLLKDYPNVKIQNSFFDGKIREK